jgi:hypothetical protein
VLLREHWALLETLLCLAFMVFNRELKQFKPPQQAAHKQALWAHP